MKKKAFYFPAVVAAVALFFALCSSAHAQIPQFQTLVGNATLQVGRSIKQLPDSGYIVAGYRGVTPNIDVYLVRLNAIGNLLWTSSYNIGGDDYAYSLDITADGGFIITGSTVNPNSCTHNDVFLMKTTNTGVLVWTRTYGATAVEEGSCVQTTSDGGFIVSGRSNSFGAGDYDAFLLKTTSTGVITWWKSYGWASADLFQSVQQTTDGGYIAGGATFSLGNAKQSLIAKVNATGDFTGGGWCRIFGGAQDEGIWSLRQTRDGGYITAGFEQSYTPTTDAFIVKFSALGGVLWNHTYEHSSNWDEFLSVKETCTGELIFSGYCRDVGFAGPNAHVVKTTSLGFPIWGRVYGDNTGTDYAWEIIQTSDGGYAFAGQTGMTVGFGNTDTYVVKMESITGTSACRDLGIIDSTNIWTLTADAVLPAVSRLVSEFPIVASRIIPIDSTLWCYSEGAIYTNPCPVINGLLQNTQDKYSAPGVVAEFARADAQEQIMFKQSTVEAGQLRVVPNPVENGSSFVLEVSAIAGEATVTITDMLGKTVYEHVYTQPNVQEGMNIATSGWNNGTYIISVKDATGVRTTHIMLRR